VCLLVHEPFHLNLPAEAHAVVCCVPLVQSITLSVKQNDTYDLYCHKYRCFIFSCILCDTSFCAELEPTRQVCVCEHCDRCWNDSEWLFRLAHFFFLFPLSRPVYPDIGDTSLKNHLLEWNKVTAVPVLSLLSQFSSGLSWPISGSGFHASSAQLGVFFILLVSCWASTLKMVVICTSVTSVCFQTRRSCIPENRALNNYVV
jgi:hypothetical protein